MVLHFSSAINCASCTSRTITCIFLKGESVYIWPEISGHQPPSHIHRKPSLGLKITCCESGNVEQEHEGRKLTETITEHQPQAPQSCARALHPDTLSLAAVAHAMPAQAPSVWPSPATSRCRCWTHAPASLPTPAAWLSTHPCLPSLSPRPAHDHACEHTQFQVLPLSTPLPQHPPIK